MVFDGLPTGIQHRSCKAKVNDPHPTVVPDQDVRGLEVSVCHRGRMRGPQSCSGLAKQLERGITLCPGSRRVRTGPSSERLALDKLHRQPDTPLLHPHVVDLDDIGVAELCKSPGFSKQAPRGCVIDIPVGMQVLDCDLAPELRVVRLKDTTHAPSTQSPHYVEAVDRAWKLGLTTVNIPAELRQRWPAPRPGSVVSHGTGSLPESATRFPRSYGQRECRASGIQGGTGAFGAKLTA